MNREYIICVIIVFFPIFSFSARAMQEGTFGSFVTQKKLRQKNPKTLVWLCLESIRKKWATVSTKDVCALANLSQVGINAINGDFAIEQLAEKFKKVHFLEQFKAHPSYIDSLTLLVSVENKIAQHVLMHNKFVAKMIKNIPVSTSCSIEQKPSFLNNEMSPNGMYVLLPVPKSFPTEQWLYRFVGDMSYGRLNDYCKKVGIYVGIYNRITKTYQGKLTIFWDKIGKDRHQVSWSEDSNYVAVGLLGGRAGICVFDIKNNTLLVKLNRYQKNNAMCFSHNGLLLACAHDDRVVLYDVDASSSTLGKSVHNFLWKDTTSRLCWSKNDTRLACVQNDALISPSILLWDYVNYAYVTEEIKTGVGFIEALCWGFGDNYLAVGLSNELFITIKIYDTRTLHCVKVLKCPGIGIRSLDWIGNSLVVRRLFTLVPKFKDYIWDMSSLYELHNLDLKQSLLFELLQNKEVALEKQCDYSQLSDIVHSLSPIAQKAIWTIASAPLTGLYAAYRNSIVLKKKLSQVG